MVGQESPDTFTIACNSAAGPRVGVIVEWHQLRHKFVHPDCGLWMLPRSVADAKMRALVASRDLFGRGGAA
jgi:hypothetical protein